MGSQIAFFDAKPYDRDIFTEVNKDFNFEIRYYKFNLTAENAILAEGAEVVCAFVKGKNFLGGNKEFHEICYKCP
jgi:D-lactate dehydrogenase